MGPSGKTHKITSTFTCASRNLIYAIICQKCGHIFIGETKTPLSVRFSDHVRSIRDNLAGRPVAAHFNQPDHSLNHVSVTGILSTSGNSDFECHVAEQRLINSLKTLKPSGINVKFDIFKCSWIV